jgi:hypothetical protein
MESKVGDYGGKKDHVIGPYTSPNSKGTVRPRCMELEAFMLPLLNFVVYLSTSSHFLGFNFEHANLACWVM